MSKKSLDPEARENQLISRAIDLAERQLEEGTASSQVITHFLKLAATKDKDRLEREKLECENEVLRAKVDMYRSAQSSEETYANAMAAFKRYSGNGGVDE
jgi:hypothetical protein